MDTIVWITGASGGIGAALAAAVPYPGATTYDLSRRGGTAGTTHVRVDLADPASWGFVAAHVAATLAEAQPRRAVFIHNAATVEPMGPAGTTDPAAYTAAVLLDAAAPQVLGASFIAAVEAAGVPEATLVQLTSGAAASPYEGWSAYCAGKAAVDMWVRTAGQEQARRDPGVRVLAIAPGVVSTGMQEAIRRQDAADFPRVERFRELHATDQLTAPEDAAAGIWQVVARDDVPTGSVVDLRTLGQDAR